DSTIVVSDRTFNTQGVHMVFFYENFFNLLYEGRAEAGVAPRQPLEGVPIQESLLERYILLDREIVSPPQTFAFRIVEILRGLDADPQYQARVFSDALAQPALQGYRQASLEELLLVARLPRVASIVQYQLSFLYALGSRIEKRDPEDWG